MGDLFDPDNVWEETVVRSAVLSDCLRYRYSLSRTWDKALRPAAFVMLNPSTADATDDDPTIRRCLSFARRWTCGGIVVVNLFAFRATDPARLSDAADPVGPDNDRHVRSAAEQCSWVVAAWGVHGTLRGRDRAVRELLARAGARPMCLGTTKDGHPRHPLYVKGDTMPTPFPEVARG